MLIEAGGIMMPGNPIKISGCADPHVMPGAATLDQHGEQIRQELLIINVKMCWYRAPTFEHCGSRYLVILLTENSNLLVQLCNVFF